MSPNVIFKNSHFAVIDKPVATLSVPSRLGREDPRPVAGILLQELQPRGSALMIL
jgi:23S rRNA-/tRNA-specific pseudouridylate synthase